VRVLLDENVPVAFGRFLVGHELLTVRAMGWTGVKNGALLQAAHGQTDAFITMDANLEFQQRLAGLPFGVVVLHSRSNRLADLEPLVPTVLAELANLEAGAVRHIPG